MQVVNVLATKMMSSKNASSGEQECQDIGSTLTYIELALAPQVACASASALIIQDELDVVPDQVHFMLIVTDPYFIR
jgi:hypothetical protein